MAKRLRNLRITEVSSVDAGAGEGVKIMLMKREIQPGANTMTLHERLALAEQRLAKAERDLQLAGLSDEHQAYCDAADLSDEEHDAFLGKTPDERDAYIAANPITKRLPPAIQKQLAEAADLRARLDALEAERTRTRFAKRATEIGLPEDDGELLLQAHQGKGEAVTALEERLKAAHAALGEAGLFREFGTTRGGTANSAKAAIEAEAARLMKSDRSLATLDQAIARIADSPMPTHRELWKRYREDDKAA
jgi:hypothetical protein